MARIVKQVVFLTAAVSCVVFFLTVSVGPVAEAVERGRDRSAEQVKDQYEDARILIEVFVAEVQLEALYEAGVSPIGQRPNAVSVDNILQCLAQENGKVVTGAKLAIGQNRKGRINQREIIYVPRQQQRRTSEGTTTQTVYNDYSAGMVFGAAAAVTKPDRIAVDFDFNQSEFDFSKQDNTPPNKVDREWKGEVTLQAGVPSIVGATQNEEAATFLILTAEIQ